MSDQVTNLDKWSRWYSLLGGEPRPYGDTETYQLGADFLKDCALVEDWGSGAGWFSRFVSAERYRGIDGSKSPFTHIYADLAYYKSDVPGIFMRHVIEHDYRWAQILENAVASFRERMVLITFTPLVRETKVLSTEEEINVPNIAFSLRDLGRFISVYTVKWQTLHTATQFGVENIFFLQK